MMQNEKKKQRQEFGFEHKGVLCVRGGGVLTDLGRQLVVQQRVVRG